MSLTHRLSTLGLSCAVASFVKPRIAKCPYTLHPKTLQYPVTVRPQTSDYSVFYQVFLQQDYAIDLPPTNGLIIDCGANVGYSAAFFLSRFPQSRAIAVEPDHENIVQLSLNLAPYGSRAPVCHAAIWPTAGEALALHGEYRDGEAWSRQVRPASGTEARRVSTTTIGDILARSKHDRIAILKIDIEGAEIPLFQSHYQDWLSKTDTILIELHDDAGPATQTFMAAIQGQGFTVTQQGDITVCRRR